VAKTLLNLSQAAKAVGITRRTLYNHVRSGKVTISRDVKNNPSVDVSELIRVYGNVKLPEKQIPTITHRENTHKNFSSEQLDIMKKELADLKQAVTLMLEDKTTREKERQHYQEQQQTLQDEVNQLRKALEQERDKSFWKRIFS
jgi:soluble cytochrome b562